jgi:hypothetical protein
MRDDPYPARFYGRQVDEPFFSGVRASMSGNIVPNNIEAAVVPFQQPLSRLLLLLMTIYLFCALFLIFTVSSYAAPAANASSSSQVAATCIERITDVAAVAAH